MRTWIQMCAGTMMLTVIASKFSYADSVPRIGYLTFLDNYVFVSFVFLTILVGGTAITAHYWLEAPEIAQETDNIVFLVSLSLWALFNLLALARGWTLWKTTQQPLQHARADSAGRKEGSKSASSRSIDRRKVAPL